MAQISVMMAAYNAESYIARALDSILAQTFTDFDVIVVDDGSKDATGAIADAYAARDSRIHVLHQPNSGVCVTRNNCIDWTYRCSDSQWILFADSDDWMHPEMLERMLRAAQGNNVHICACGYQETTGADPVIDPKDLEPQVWEPMAFYQASYVNAIMTCCKLYHKSCYEHVRHPVDNYFDDEFVSYKMLYPEKRMVVIPAPLYAYFINTEGLTKRAWTPKLLDAWVAYEEQIAFFREKGEEELVSFRLRGYLENAMTNYQAAGQAPDSPEIAAARKRIRKKIRELIRRMRQQGCLSYRFDFDTILEFYPVRARLYRLVREKTEGLRRKNNA
ncbi:MAG: glycosyltransferase family 2 protein [Firmicutes bacterium]|nr:glycosyltransferase family 2 protein [Bacillota bacterium]